MHSLGKLEAEIGVHDKGHAALAGLGIHTDDGLIDPADVRGIDRKIGDIPDLGLAVLHGLDPLVDRILVGAREGGKHELARVGMALIHAHLVAALIDVDDLIDILDIQPGVDALGEHIVGDREQVHIHGALTVAQKRPLHALCAGQEGKLGGGDAAAAVIVGMDAEDDAVAVLEMPAHPLDLIRVDIGGVHLHRGGKIEDHGLFPGGLPDILYGGADLQCEIKLRAGKAFRRIFKLKVSVITGKSFLYHSCAFNGYLCDFFLALVKYNVAL